MRLVRRVLIGILLTGCLAVIAGTTHFLLRYQVHVRISDRQRADLVVPGLADLDAPGVVWPPAASSDDVVVDQSAALKENPAALAAIQEELRDASPEEHEIWYSELKQHSPQQIREILSLHRRIWPNPPALSSEKFELAKGEAREPQRLLEQLASRASRRSVEAAAFVEPSLRAIESAERVILNNIANAGTVGFKRRRPVFTEESPRQVEDRELDQQPALSVTTTSATWAGTSLAEAQVDHAQGRLRHTKQPLDLAIDGDGFFQIYDGSQILYTRAGTFSVNQNSQVVLVSGERRLVLKPGIALPQDTVQISICSGGIVSVLQAGTLQLQQIGRIQLARFISPAELKFHGDQLFAETVASGKPQISVPGADGLGKICQLYLEEANVDLPAELAELRRLHERLQALRTARGDLGVAPGRVEHSDVK